MNLFLMMLSCVNMNHYTTVVQHALMWFMWGECVRLCSGGLAQWFVVVQIVSRMFTSTVAQRLCWSKIPANMGGERCTLQLLCESKFKKKSRHKIKNTKWHLDVRTSPECKFCLNEENCFWSLLCHASLRLSSVCFVVANISRVVWKVSVNVMHKRRVGIVMT